MNLHPCSHFIAFNTLEGESTFDENTLWPFGFWADYYSVLSLLYISLSHTILVFISNGGRSYTVLSFSVFCGYVVITMSLYLCDDRRYVIQFSSSGRG